MNAAEWNASCAPGTLVAYHPILGETASRLVRTRSLAWELGHGAAVVSITGVAGGVLLESLKVIAVKVPDEHEPAGDVREGK